MPTIRSVICSPGDHCAIASFPYLAAGETTTNEIDGQTAHAPPRRLTSAFRGCVRHLEAHGIIPRMSPPRLIVVCGLPGSGKTTLARELEASLDAVRMCPDEWMDALHIDLWDSA